MHVLIILLLSESGPDTVYGHIHIAKTGGTTLNEILANEYEGVCGHKGYSFDIYQALTRARGQGVHEVGRVHDSIYQRRAGYDRLRVPTGLMVERGFEDCKWISHEVDMAFWHRFKNWPFELHLPCRDPVEHFMSQVNHGRREIQCHSFVPSRDAGSYLIQLNGRFRLSAVPEFAKLKCVHFRDQFDTYPRSLGLKRKDPRAVVSNFRPLATNKKRDRSSECIWRDKRLQDELREHLLKTYDYYRYCANCTDWVGEPEEPGFV